MNLKIRKWGNSAAVLMPPTLLSQMGVTIGDSLLVVSANTKTLTMRPVRAKPRYTLEELMAQCDLQASEPAEVAEWSSMPLVGRES